MDDIKITTDIEATDQLGMLVRRIQMETMRRVSKIAVNIEARIPTASVTAKPLTVPVPK